MCFKCAHLLTFYFYMCSIHIAVESLVDIVFLVRNETTPHNMFPPSNVCTRISITVFSVVFLWSYVVCTNPQGLWLVTHIDGNQHSTSVIACCMSKGKLICSVSRFSSCCVSSFLSVLSSTPVIIAFVTATIIPICPGKLSPYISPKLSSSQSGHSNINTN